MAISSEVPRNRSTVPRDTTITNSETSSPADQAMSYFRSLLLANWLRDFVFLPGEFLLDLDRLDDVARRFLVTLVDTLIDDESHTRELLGSRFKYCNGKRRLGSRLLPLAGPGNQKCTTVGLGHFVVLDVLQALFETLLKLFDSILLVFYTVQ